ncbi:MAG: hypothetical protein HPY57_13530 [Ignavibacteria bacterium]|nr:hypothetical protein [Ignavibacteria bacterium]
MNFIVDKAKALKKWAPVLDHLQVSDIEKRTWMAEYAEMHQLNENVAYSTLGNIYGMGNVQAPVIGGAGLYGGTNTYTGTGAPVTTGAIGSGDVAQNLLPVSMKIAAQTIGLDLVAVKPASSPRLELLFVDFKYDNNPQGHGNLDGDEQPLVFKLNVTDKTTLLNQLTYTLGVLTTKELIGGLDKRVFVTLTGGSFTNVFEPTTTPPTGNKLGVLEFLGFSRVDGLPMFRSYRQNNNAAAGNWGFDQNKNTFGYATSVVSQLEGAYFYHLSGSSLLQITGATIELVSTMEDHLPGFSAGWYINHAMSRLEDENTYPGVIGPDVFTKSVAVGDIEISSALKRTQIEDIKASTGMDIVQKLESVLINELTQTISKQIVDKIRTLAGENRASHTTPKDASGNSKFDFNVDDYTAVAGPAPGGETYHSIQRKLVAKINNASNFIATDGRVGPAQYLITNGNLASVLQDVAGYTIAPTNVGKLNTNGQLYPMGNIGNITIYVDPYMRWDDNRIFLGRKNSVDQPGLVFIPYLMAQSISLISEATWAPRMLIRSRYAITDIGFFPWKQFMEIRVTDNNGVLI